MSGIYMAVLEINSDGIAKRMNRQIAPASVYRESGFEFRVLYCDDVFFRLRIFVQNGYSTCIPGSCEENGNTFGGKLNVPILVETDGGFAGVLCSYIFCVSRKPLCWDTLYQTLGIDHTWIPEAENYKTLVTCPNIEAFRRTFMSFPDPDCQGSGTILAGRGAD